MKQRIYTPGVQDPFTGLNFGDQVQVHIQETDRTYRGKVFSKPRNSYDDQDHRVTIIPDNDTWLGQITVCATSNDYNWYHTSEVTITPRNK